MLEGTVLLKNGIHVADEQNAFATFSGIGTCMFGNQRARALHFVHGNPPNFETERLEFRHERLANSAHTFQVLGPAVDLNQSAQKIDRLLRISVDGGNDLCLRGIQILGLNDDGSGRN